MVKYFWFLVAFSAIAIGLYPVMYLVVDMMSHGLLGGKGVLTESNAYMHLYRAPPYPMDFS